MIYRDIITHIAPEYESDGMGGYTLINDEVSTDILCRVSYEVAPEVANAFGYSCEQMIYVVAPEQLGLEGYYLINGKRYTGRFQTKGSRFYKAYLVEEKQIEETQSPTQEEVSEE